MTSKLGERTQFPLLVEGPLYRLYLRTRLVAPPLLHVTRRVVVVSLFAWLPLLVLSALSGRAWDGVAVPFLFDVELHARFLLALPLLVGSEPFVQSKIQVVVRQFYDRELLSPAAQPHFERYITSAISLRNSALIELLLFVAAVCFYWVWKTHVALDVATWYAVPGERGVELTPAGWWYVFISLPLFRFLLFRWYFRVLIWYRLLWQVGRHIPLRLNALHPDCCAGLGFLPISVLAFAPLLLAHTVFISGVFANHILIHKVSLLDYQIDLFFWLGGLVLLPIFPLLFFVPQLARARRTALREYGTLGSRYVRSFHDKWMRADSAGREELLGSADIQSLADLANSFDVVRRTNLIPIGWATIVRLILLIALPFAPLTVTLIPFEELVNRMWKMLL